MGEITLKLKQELPIPIAEPEQTNIVKTVGKGIASLKYKSVPTPSGGVAIGKDRYYGSSVPNVVWKPVRAFDEGVWKTEVKAILKPVKNPIPMYAKSNMGEMSGYVRIPELNKDYGYDLMIGQALPPFGKGEVADFYFRVEGSYTDRKSNDLKLVGRKFFTFGREQKHFLTEALRR